VQRVALATAGRRPEKLEMPEPAAALPARAEQAAKQPAALAVVRRAVLTAEMAGSKGAGSLPRVWLAQPVDREKPRGRADVAQHWATQAARLGAAPGAPGAESSAGEAPVATLELTAGQPAPPDGTAPRTVSVRPVVAAV
jgi:hypothetical protein